MSGHRSVRTKSTGLKPFEVNFSFIFASSKGVGPPAPAQASTKIREIF
ncbi:unnamed protein product [Periconia digitata]|uniref:Uncharacterized protein n=1 Tax=Periconia digitata TaxID=1303443 RepID=A0A9W4XJH9_9PLEO|nr:unnamed protein product [Periconia digitata]